MFISYLYVQTITRQCFCFPNSQWGVTVHDNIYVIYKITIKLTNFFLYLFIVEQSVIIYCNYLPVVRNMYD